jgi:hypothetical protein
MNLADIITECQKVKGWFTPDQMRELYPLVKDIEGVLVEIGTYHGKSTKYWRLANPKLDITTIDIIDDPAPPLWVDGYEAGSVIDKDILELGNITAIQDDNRNVAKTWKKPIDILFIDGDERYDSIYGDMEAWWPFVKKGGRMFVHNYCTGNQDTRRAVNDWSMAHKIDDSRIIAEVWVVTK